MKRTFIIIGLLLIFCFWPKVNAYVLCNDDEIEVLKKYASNITYILEPVINENNTAKFNLTFSGISNNFRLSLDINGIDYSNYYPGKTGALDEIILNDLTAGGKYIFKVHGAGRCYTYTFRTFTINLPEYNPYSTLDICKDAREFKLCQRWTKTNADYDSFVQKVNEYKESKKVVEEKKIIQVERKNLIYAIYENYYWYFLVSLIIILSVLIHLWIKEQKKNRL